MPGGKKTQRRKKKFRNEGDKRTIKKEGNTDRHTDGRTQTDRKKEREKNLSVYCTPVILTSARSLPSPLSLYIYWTTSRACMN